MEMYRSGTQDDNGVHADMTKARETELGAKIMLAKLAFDSLVLAIHCESCDALILSTSGTPARAAKLDFVEQFMAAAVIIVAENNPQKIDDAQDLCGKQLATTRAVITLTLAESFQSERGSHPIVIQQTQDAPNAAERMRCSASTPSRSCGQDEGFRQASRGITSAVPVL